MINTITSRNRSAFALIFVLVSVAVVALLLVATARSTTLLRDRTSVVQSHDQAVWLAVSAMNRATRMASMDETYRGETWKPQWESMNCDAEAAIEIERNADELLIDVEIRLIRNGVRISGSTQRRVIRSNPNPETGDE